MKGKGTSEHENSSRYPRIQALLSQLEQEEGRLTLKSLAVDGNDLMDLGYQGRQIGEELRALLEQVLEGILPNEKAALIQAAQKLNSV